MAMNKGVFLDRDGVINKSLVVNGKPYAPTCIADFVILPGVKESLMSLKEVGFKTIIVTNQPDVGTGKQTIKGLAEIHDYLTSHCSIDLIKVCIHTDEDCCNCRKPRPGMILEAARDLKIDLTESFMIGDRWKDIEAGQRAGCKEIFFIDHSYDEKGPEGAFTVVNSLHECAEKIIGYR